jgi:hypothetical protein
LSATKEGLKDVSQSNALIPSTVVFGPLLLIAQNLIGMSDGLESFLRLLIRIYVWVKLASQFAVGLFDFFRGRVLTDAQNLVVIAQLLVSIH